MCLFRDAEKQKPNGQMTSPSKKPNQEQTQLPFSKDSAPAQSASPNQLCGAFRELKNDERHVTEA